MSFADLIIAAQTRATRHSSSSPSPDSPSDLTLDSGVHLCPLRVQASIGSEPNPTFYKGRGPPPRAGQRQPLRSGPPRASSFLVCSLSAASPHSRPRRSAITVANGGGATTGRRERPGAPLTRSWGSSPRLLFQRSHRLLYRIFSRIYKRSLWGWKFLVSEGEKEPDDFSWFCWK